VLFRSPTSSASSTPIAVPNVLTMSRAQAEQLLTSDGFVVAVKFGTNALGAGIVYDQSPKATATAAPGSTVTIWVGK
jgi:beta-lactam-binding protein with PASTA domain